MQQLQKLTLIMVLLNGFATPLMLSAANVALPAIAKDLDMNAVQLSWVPMSYLMASAMFVLIFGRLADIYGRKKIFLTGTGCVVITSILAASSPNELMLISARFLQGVSAAMLYASQMAIVSSVFPPEKRGHAIGLAVSSIYAGLTCGPVLGGILIDNFGWRASFIFHVPLSLTVLLIGLLKVKEEWLAEGTGHLDIKGSIIYSLSIMGLCIGIANLPAIHSLVFLLPSITGILIFIYHASHSPHPIFDISQFFTNRVFGFSCIAALIIYTATFANVVLISLYLQYIKGISASFAGLIMMIQPLTMAIFSPLAGRFSDNYEPGIIASFGMLLTASGLLMLANLTSESMYGFLISALVLTGLGFSLFSSPNTNAIMGAVDKRNYGSASGTVATMRVLGQMCSMILVTLIFALVIGQVNLQPAYYPELQNAIHICFLVAASLCIPGFIFSLVRGRIHVR